MYYTKSMKQIKREMRTRMLKIERAELKSTLSAILSRLVTPNSAVSILAVAGTLPLIASHVIV